MSELLHHTDEFLSLEDDERWALVQRVASSRLLLRAPQLREILVYVCRRMLAEQASGISEQEIGCKVLGRRPDFNPNEDNIVRVQIRHLRRKLEEYFSADGADEPIILNIPKGGYLPRFEPRPEQPTDAMLSGSMTLAVHEAASSPSNFIAASPSAKERKPWTVPVLLVLLGFLALFGAFLWKDLAALRRSVTAERAPAVHEDSLWSRMFMPHQQTSIVIADTNFVLIQDILHADIPLSKYLEGGYPEKLIDSVPNRELQAALRLVATRQYTSLGDVMLSSKLLELSRRYSGETNLRYSRQMSVREFKTGNFILIGSRRGIPWEQLFESQLNFNVEEDHATHLYHLRNKSPQAGERQVYGISSGGRANQYTYADLALLPNLAGTGYVLVLSGIDMPATEAAGELAAQPDFGATLVRLLKSRAGQPPASYIEMLIEAKATAGTSGGGAKIIAYRLIEGSRPAS